MEITYRQEGDYLIPNLTAEEEEPIELGRFGEMRKEFLKEKHTGLYRSWLVLGTLNEKCKATEQRAMEMKKLLMKQMAESEGLTEELKTTDPDRYTCEMNNLSARVDEIVIAEVIEA